MREGHLSCTGPRSLNQNSMLLFVSFVICCSLVFAPDTGMADWDDTIGAIGMDTNVDSLALAPDGTLYAGGDFTMAGTTYANHIAGWKGGSWFSLWTGVSNRVYAIAAAPDGALYVGGYFSTIANTSIKHLARWNGVSWSSVGSGVNDKVAALALAPDGTLYAGGTFTEVGGIKANRIAKWDGVSWSPLGAGMDGSVSTIALAPDGVLYAAGTFGKAGKVEADGVAKWDGVSWSPLGLGTDGVINSLVVAPDGTLYAGGTFDKAGGLIAKHVAKWNGVSWSSLGSGISYTVEALALASDGALYAGGYFTEAGGSSANNIAKWNGVSWSSLGKGVNNTVSAIIVAPDGTLYAGGRFTSAGGKTSNYIASYTPTPPTTTTTPPTTTTIIPAPTADFSASSISGSAPFTTKFTDDSGGSITSWAWSFGDGSTSTDRNPSHTYRNAGTYTVSLTVNGPGGSSAKTRSGYITVIPSGGSGVPAADFSASPTSGVAPFTTKFTDGSSGTIAGWAWDFGDGKVSTAQNPSHTYRSGGTYTVSLTVSGSGGSDTKTRRAYISVSSSGSADTPTADFSTASISGTAPFTVKFMDDSSGTITGWAWDFGDGSTSTAQNPVHTYDSVGIYTVSLLVAGPGGSSTKTRTGYIVVATKSMSNISVWQDWFAVDSRETPMVGDFNGDYKADIVTFTRDNPNAVGNVYVALSDGAAFGRNQKWNDWFAINQEENIVIGDFNGDFMDDIATWLCKSSRQVYVATSYGSGLNPSVLWLGKIGDNSDDVLKAGDVNADGKCDLILFSRRVGKVYVALSNGDGFESPQVWHSWFAVSIYERPEVGDVDGDGRADIITFCTDSPTSQGSVFVAVSTGSQFGDGRNSDKWNEWFAVDPAQKIRVGDINGDGMVDFATFLPDPYNQVYVVYSQAVGMSENHLIISEFPATSTDQPYLADVNGDGMDDLVLFRKGEGKAYVVLTKYQ